MFDVSIYASINDFQQTATNNVINRYGNFIKWNQGASMLEVGCGNGGTTAKILMPFIEKNIQEFSFSGTDLLESMIDQAKNAYKNIHFVQLDISTDNLDDNHIESYHNIFSFFCLHLVPNYKNWMKNIHSILKPGGQVFFLIPTQNPLCTETFKQYQHGKWAKYLKCAGEIAGTPFSQLLNPKDWILSRLKEHRIKHVICDEINEVYVFENLQHLKGFIMAFKVIYQDIPQDILDDFLKEFTELVAQRCEQVAGTSKYKFHYSMLLVVAEK